MMNDDIKQVQSKELLKAIPDNSGLEINLCNLNMTKTVRGWLDCTQGKKFDKEGGSYSIEDEKAPLTHIIGQCFSITELLQGCHPALDSRFPQLSNFAPTAIHLARAIDPSVTYYLQSVFPENIAYQRS
jgi:hypothetical protein